MERRSSIKVVGGLLPFGRRVLPFMVARWVFNRGSALAVALNLVE
jgi:hypothetical protein